MSSLSSSHIHIKLSRWRLQHCQRALHNSLAALKVCRFTIDRLERVQPCIDTYDFFLWPNQWRTRARDDCWEIGWFIGDEEWAPGCRSTYFRVCFGFMCLRCIDVKIMAVGVLGHIFSNWCKDFARFYWAITKGSILNKMVLMTKNISWDIAVRAFRAKNFIAYLRARNVFIYLFFV